MQKLQAIFLDIDDTLYSTTDFTELARQIAIKNMIKAGLKMKPEDAYSELLEVIAEFSSNFDAHFDKLLSRIPKHTYKDAFPPLLIAAAVAGYHDTKRIMLKPFPDALNFIKTIRDKTNLALGIITDGLRIKQAEKLWRLDVWKYFNQKAIFISDDIGISKPNPKLYQKACQSLGIKPSQALYVGDNPINDVDPPNKIGMVTVLLKREGKYKDAKSETEPNYTVFDFSEILTILKRDFAIDGL